MRHYDAMTAPKPHNEDERINTLRLYGILDTHAEKIFDDLTRLAASICDTPISLISLVDTSRQWFKSRVGLEAKETPRDLAFCGYAIHKNEIMVVNDATRDARFQKNALVTGDPNIRFYAGAPLFVGDNVALGTLCVIDTKPREMSRAQLDSLAILRDAIVGQLELRRKTAELQMLESYLPLCAWCGNIENDDGSWTSVREYVSNAMVVTHGICPDCKCKERADWTAKRQSQVA